MITRQIQVSFQREGIHCYPAAATDLALADVAFLANPHRHIFHFYVNVSVVHNDRDIEFIMLKRELEKLYSNSIMQCDNKSCEMLAEDLINYLVSRYPGRTIEVSVFEDNENGAVLNYVQD
jgi:uncharacterized protein YqgQ